jgi:hypothetical protein
MRFSEKSFAKNSLNIHLNPSSLTTKYIHREMLGFLPGAINAGYFYLF